METILDRLADAARARVVSAKQQKPPGAVRAEAETLAAAEPEKAFRFEKAIAGDGMHFICECKKASPSKGLIAPEFPYLEIAKDYEAAGASAISVLTEPQWFLGENRYLREIAGAVSIPCLRKDFTVDPYMIYEAKVLGASAVLLICAILDREELKDYLAAADSLGLSAVVEAHDAREVRMAADAGAKIIGVNNRNLRDFTVDIGNCLRMRDEAPDGTLFIAESGIRTPEDIRTLEAHDIHAVLIGEQLMRAADRRAELRRLAGGDRKTHLKICGLRTPSDVEAVNAAAPDFAGFIFDPSRRRYIRPEEAELLRRRLGNGIHSVGVFVNAPAEEILDVLRCCPVDAVQLHGQESNAEIEALRAARPGLFVIKAFRVDGPEDVERAETSRADLILLDHGAGGTGEAFDWSLLRHVKRPFLLAGGLSADNVAEAIRLVHPWGVDASSSLETDGHKDAEKVKRFAVAVRDIRSGAERSAGKTSYPA